MVAALSFPAIPSVSAPVAAAAPATQQAYAGHVGEAARRFGVPEVWIWRVMHVESRGKPRALSHAGAMGLMQIMPATWRMLTARHGLGADPYDPRANILAGAAYLRQMWDRYGDVRLMLAAYNAGPGRADAYAAGRRGLPAETVAYVAQIAPSLGASGVASLAPAPPTGASGWRSASLFALQPERRAAVSGQPLAAPAEVPPPRALDAQPSLFIPLSGRAD